MHYAFYKENRKIIAENGGITFLHQLITQYIDDRSLVKESINLAWNLGCDLGERVGLNITANYLYHDRAKTFFGRLIFKISLKIESSNYLLVKHIFLSNTLP